MITSMLVKSILAIVLFGQASAFIATSPTSAGMGAAYPSTAVARHPPSCGTTCHATDKNKKDVSGIGGLNFGRLPPREKGSAARAPPKKGAAKKNTRQAGKVKKNAGAKLAPGAGPSADVDWGKIALTFLIPWRNPNSIFLYMLIIVSVLGKINETPQ